MIRFSNIFFLTFFLIQSYVQAQSLRGLQENPVIKDYSPKEKVSLKSAASTTGPLYLPFFEDFSTSTVFPDPAKWTDRCVYINNSYGKDPASVGVATFDAIDSRGNVYAADGIPVSSDTLTSVEFDLSVYQGTTNTVRLSFFYQCGGRGEVPDPEDILVLEYYYPPDTVWEQVWFVNGGEVTQFTQVILKVPSKYYVNGFRFRFRNYTSLSADQVRGGIGALNNGDIWNLDYIMMNTDPEYNHQTINNDITITDIPRNILDLYETVPWHHLNSAVASGFARNSIVYGIRNYMPDDDSSNIGRSYYVINYNAGTREEYLPPADEILPNGMLVFRDLPLFANLSRNDNRSEGRIEVVSYLRTLDFGTKDNDTSRVILHFKDSYVYDDGTPEYGFGISGNSTAGALVAQRFRVFEPDTLTAVEIYFNRTLNDYTASLPFQICVWNDASGKPGDLLYISEELYYPDFSSQISGFNSFPILSDIIVQDSIVYVGYKQQTEEFLNVGYDVNNSTLSRSFINTSGSWTHPTDIKIPGTIMIRAVFGNKGIATSGSLPDAPLNEIVVYPNPVTSVMHISSGEPVNNIIITDMTGRIILKQTGNIQSVDLSSTPNGVYTVLLSTETGERVTKKIVISH